jgi:homoserine O-acetyltransferase
MGGMLSWVWGVRYPQFMDAIVPMACQPSSVAGRNQMMRRLAIEAIRTDPDYCDGNYLEQPRSLKLAETILKIGFNGGNLGLLDKAPTRAAADALVAQQLAEPAAMDANDFIYRFAASRDYDPGPHLDRIEAAVLAINAADDERNPPENGIVGRATARLSNGRLLLIPAGTETSGHGTTANARFYKEELGKFLEMTPRRAPSEASASPTRDRRSAS